MSTISASGYSDFVYASWTSIHELRFSAVSPQVDDRVLPRAAHRVHELVGEPLADALREAWLTNTSRTESGASVSDVATAMPLSSASCSTGAIELGSLGATTIVSTPCWM